jgi:hypothetical protein
MITPPSEAAFKTVDTAFAALLTEEAAAKGRKTRRSKRRERENVSTPDPCNL